MSAAESTGSAAMSTVAAPATVLEISFPGEMTGAAAWAPA
jgi:hypothetical protein